MFDRDLDSLDADATLTHVSRLRTAADRLEADILSAACHWADLHGTVDWRPSGALLPGTERLETFGGDGTPEVAGFAPAELGAELGVSTFAATLLIGDALDLRHRLPRLWARVQAGEVKAWVGRKVAQASRELSSRAVAKVDARVSRWADRLTWGRLEKVVQAAVIDADPQLAKAKADRLVEDHGVWLNRSTEHGTRTAVIRGDALDLMRFDASVDRIADGIAILGDTTDKSIRRARAVGILANPQQALDLYTTVADTTRGVDPTDLPDDITREQDPTDPDPGNAPTDGSGGRPVEREGEHTAPVSAPAPDVSCTCGGRRRVDPRPPATLYVHLSHDAVTGSRCTDGVARVEGVGPVTIEQAKRWLGHCTVTVKPVIDLAGVIPVDCYEIPDRIREAVHLIIPADVFPYATNTTRTMDLDHSDPYVPPDQGGPPGQTGVGKLGPMTRRHHRVKTHSRWQVQQPYPGIYLWRSPHGRYYLVDHTGTRKLPESA